MYSKSCCNSAGAPGRNRRVKFQSLPNFLVPPVRLLAAGFALSVSAAAVAADPSQAMFQRVFGEAAVLDPAMVEKVKAAPAGERHYVDRDGDGRPEEVWFIDIASRHPEQARPVLVRVIDEDGDLVMGGEPDRDSDLYIADWKADGTVDGVVSYLDTDGDNDVDEMAFYFYAPSSVGFHGDGLRVWWSRDDGDDNLLWFHEGYRYFQPRGQLRTHFNGDESFCAFFLPSDGDVWVPFWENPFLFFDRDEDGVTEEVIRVSGTGRNVRTLRWSFDADNDATLESPRDYDVSISAFAPGWQGEDQNSFVSDLEFSDVYGERITLRGIETGLFLDRHRIRGFLKPVVWARVLMTWVENDHNVGYGRGEGDERWEGVIMHSPEGREGIEMGAIGGPSAGPFNNRNEIVLHPEAPNEFYFHPGTGRIHLRYADRGWIDVDWDLDREADMTYEFHDMAGDGYFDTVTLDFDGDGDVDDQWTLDMDGVRRISWSWEEIHAAWRPVVEEEPRALYELNRVLTAALAERGENDEVWELLQSGFTGNDFPEESRRKFAESDAALLYYLRLVRDRALVKLKKTGGDVSDGFWARINEFRGRNDLAGMTEAVRQEFSVRASAMDFGAFVHELRAEPDRPRVAWDNQWLPPNWGWESEKVAYRMYEGHFDFFGKSRDVLIYPAIIHELADGGSYHVENEWGIDALHVGQTAGCGGVILYVNGKAYPVYNDGENGPRFSGRLVEETNDRVTLEMTVENVGPADAPYTVRLRPSALAGEAYSPVEVLVTGGRPADEIAVGIGLNRLPVQDLVVDTQIGVMGVWGWQEPAIGWIGTGVIWPATRYLRIDDQPEEQRVVLRAEAGKAFTYSIQCDWLNGRQYPDAPAAADWLATLRKTAGTVRSGR